MSDSGTRINKFLSEVGDAEVHSDLTHRKWYMNGHLISIDLTDHNFMGIPAKKRDMNAIDPRFLIRARSECIWMPSTQKYTGSGLIACTEKYQSPRVT